MICTNMAGMVEEGLRIDNPTVKNLLDAGAMKIWGGEHKTATLIGNPETQGMVEGYKNFLDAEAMKIWRGEHKTSALVGNLGTSGSVFIRVFTSRAAAESYSGNRCCSWEGDIWLLCLLRSLCMTESSWEGDIW